MSSSSDYMRVIAQLEEAKGQALGQARAQSGQIWGQTIANLGNTLPQQVTQAIQMGRVRNILQQSGGDLAQAIPQIMKVAPELGMQMSDHLLSSAKIQMELRKNAEELRESQYNFAQKQIDTARNAFINANDQDSYSAALLGLGGAGYNVSGAPRDYYTPEAKAYIEQQRNIFAGKEALLEKLKPIKTSRGENVLFQQLGGETEAAPNAPGGTTPPPATPPPATPPPATSSPIANTSPTGSYSGTGPTTVSTGSTAAPTTSQDWSAMMATLTPDEIQAVKDASNNGTPLPPAIIRKMAGAGGAGAPSAGPLAAPAAAGAPAQTPTPTQTPPAPSPATAGVPKLRLAYQAPPEPPKTEAELRLDAQNKNSPTQAQSAATIKQWEADREALRRQSGGSDTSRYIALTAKPADQRTAEENAWIKAYQDAKDREHGMSLQAYMDRRQYDIANPPPGTVSSQSVVVRGVDDQGNPITQIVPKTPGATYKAAPSATIQNRIASAKTALQVSDDIEQKLQDPNYLKVIGPVLGRYSQIQDWWGDPPPELRELKGMAKGYSDAMTGVHGYRSPENAARIAELLTAKSTPEAIISALHGLNDFSMHLLDNENIRITKPIPGAPGMEQTYINGKWIRTK